MELRFGPVFLGSSFDPHLAARFETIEPVPVPTAPGAKPPSLDDAVTECARTAPLEPGESALILVPDRTRWFPVATALPTLVRGLVSRGVSPRDITVMIAGGTHRSSREDVAAARLGPLPDGVSVTAHDCDATDAYAGTTPAGTEVRVNPALLRADRVFALGGTAFHYFAGFGGGPKLLFPGAGARASVAANHARSLGPWPPGGLALGVEPGRLAGNPVAADLAAAAQLLPRAEHVTGWRVAGGAWRGVRWREPAEFVRLCAQAAQGRRAGVRHGYDVAWASAGGWPHDLDVVQAHKALLHASLYVQDGGRLLFSAACSEGYGSAAMERWLAAPDRAALESGARARYDLNAQTAISLVTIAARLRVTWIADGELPLLERWGVRVVPLHDSARALAEAASSARGARVAHLPAASDVLPVAPLETNPIGA